jgi:hypothetical protein
LRYPLATNATIEHHCESRGSWGKYPGIQRLNDRHNRTMLYKRVLKQEVCGKRSRKKHCVLCEGRSE